MNILLIKLYPTG